MNELIHTSLAPPTPVSPGLPPGSSRHESATNSRARKELVARAVLGLVAVWIFLSAIAVMKDGAAALAPHLNGSTLTNSLPSTLGFGWLGAMLIMSGSPVAVSSLALLDGRAVSVDGAFMMLTGSRLGAAFVVLTVAFVYALRGRTQHGARRASLSIGIFALLLTAAAYLPAMAIGLPLLHSDAMRTLTGAEGFEAFNIVKTITGPIVGSVEAIVPAGALFFAGLALLLVSLRLIDHALPAAEADTLEEHADWRSRKWIMFAFGSLVALVTMSVSVALTVLVPAVAKGYLRRRQAVPYIMGANITTLGDTLLTAYLIGNPDGVRAVLSELVGVTLVTLVLLTVLYRPLNERLVLVTDGILASRRRVGLFVAALFCVPIALIWVL